MSDIQPPKSRYNLRTRHCKKNYKVKEHSDSDDSDSDYDPEEEEVVVTDFSEEEGEQEFKLRQFQKFVSKIFPSKASEKRIKELEQLDEVSENAPKKKKKKKKKKKRKEEEEEEEDFYMTKSDANEKVNIILTLDGGAFYEGFDGEYYDDADDEEEEGEDEETYEKDDIVNVKLEDWDEPKKGTILKVRKRLSDDGELVYKVKCENEVLNKVETKYVTPYEEDEDDLLLEMKELAKRKGKGGSEAMMQYLDTMVQAKEKKDKKKREKEEKKEQLKNLREFKKLLNDKNMTNDFKYYKDLDIKKQTFILDQIKEINKLSNTDKPYRISLLETDIPTKFKASALKKVNTLTFMDRCSGEYYKLKQWVDMFMQIPFGKHNSLPVSMDNGLDACHEFMAESKKILDECVYGLNDAKMQIIQMIGQWISNPQAVGTAIAIHGPMGTGKTTLVRDGISKILKRPFAFLPLGGATDSSYLEGHSYTYEGSVWGKIVDVLIQNKSMNPVFYFDELDKVSNTPKGEEIIGILTHLTDTTQNTQFHDKYFSDVDFDLSKALFIFSYNEDDKVNPILKDRMYCIKTKGYDKKEKTIIARDYLIPAIEKNVNFKKGDIEISEEIVHYLIDNYTKAEKGVRNLKRCLEIIFTKLNLFRLMKPDTKLFDDEVMTMKVEFPFKVEQEMVGKLIKKYDKVDVPMGMYM